MFGIVNDFTAYDNPSRCSVKGYFAYPICEDNTHSMRSEHYIKNGFLGNHKFLI
ncbi:hypothetical protein Lalb_Chr18g0053181 [Lupinus albus]|uniref:Uncharacterized protein n=1 Tax=Lupinus albus TaxID=3870 RepID=A0A6A4NYZ5_LUPAL|nr:hypothetical protein Lalb_Chr18g0053181 [Lupinus albus]